MKFTLFFQYLVNVACWPRWLRRKWRKKCTNITRFLARAAAVSVIVVGAFYAAPTEVKAVDIGNHRTVNNYNQGSSATYTNVSDPSDPNYPGYWNNNGVAGTPGTYDATGAWFGLNASNHVFVHVNATNGGTVTITQLDVDTAGGNGSSYSYYTGGTDHTADSYYSYGPGYVGNPNPYNNAAAHTYNGSGTFTLSADTHLVTSPALMNQLFTITGNVDKDGAGTLFIDGGNYSIGGYLHVNGGGFEHNSNNSLTVGNGLTVAGGAHFTKSAGNLSITNNGINNAGTFSSGSGDITLSNTTGNLTNSGTFTKTGGNTTVSGTTGLTNTGNYSDTGGGNLTISGTGADLNNGGTFTKTNGNLSVNDDVINTGTFTKNGTGAFTVGGDFLNQSGSATIGGTGTAAISGYLSNANGATFNDSINSPGGTTISGTDVSGNGVLNQGNYIKNGSGTTTVTGHFNTQNYFMATGSGSIAVLNNDDILISGTATWDSSGTWSGDELRVGEDSPGIFYIKQGEVQLRNKNVIGNNHAGTVYLSGGHWNAGTQTVEIGKGGEGIVNQSGGRWTNGLTDIGVGSHGRVNQSGGDHNDQNAIIGDSTNGEYYLSGSDATNWTTENNAIIGKGSTANRDVIGVVDVADDSNWTIAGTSLDNRSALVVGDYARGILNIHSSGDVLVEHGDVIGARQDRTNRTANNVYQSQIYVDSSDGSGSTLTVEDGKLTVAQGKYTNGQMNVSYGGAATVKNDVTIADQEGSRAAMRVHNKDGSGNNSSLTITDGNLIVANDTYSATEPGSGFLYIYDEGDVLLSGNGVADKGHIIIANKSGSEGVVWVEGADSTLKTSDPANGSLIVAKSDPPLQGNEGKTWGLLDINTGAEVDIAAWATIAQLDGARGTVRVDAATFNVGGDLITADENGAFGNLYARDGAQVYVAGDHIIADDTGSFGRDHIDGSGTKMTVAGTLNVARAGHAGGEYTENRYDPRYQTQTDPTDGSWNLHTGYKGIHQYGEDNMTKPNPGGAPYGDVDPDNPNPKYAGEPGELTTGLTEIPGDGLNTGNDPGLAITRGAEVYSGAGMIGETSTGYGYVVIDNLGAWSGDRSKWVVDQDQILGSDTGKLTEYGTGVMHNQGYGTADGKLVIAENGGAFVRVLNGGLLHTGSTHVGEGTGDGTLHVVGAGSEWISDGPTVLGEASGGNGTIRINDGAHGSTEGLYIGYIAGSEGEVSVKGKGSLLDIYKDNSGLYPNKPAGSSSLTVSELAKVWMHDNSEVLLNGNGVFSNGATLHLDAGSILDATTRGVTVTNARVEGIGTVTGKDGVNFHQDDWYTDHQAYIDPGLVYGWECRCENPGRYGTLTFGHTLSVTGNVITNFDVNASAPGNPDGQDHIVVKGHVDETEDQVTAALGGELRVHARLTDYYQKDTDLRYDIVTTEGANGSKGEITHLYDKLTVVPYRFFSDIRQVVEENGAGDDVLYVTMRRNNSPFSDAAETYNQRSTGGALDSIYALDDQRWLPVLRYFWYLGDPDFLNAYSLFSGEIRAHSLLLPTLDPWTYAHDRVGFSRETGHVVFGGQNRSYAFERSNGLWASAIYNETKTGGDGNASGYDITRTGLVAGFDRASQGGDSYLGGMFLYNRGELDSFRSSAKDDDIQFGLYQGLRFNGYWEWKNYLGFGWQNYQTSREMSVGLGELRTCSPTTCMADCMGANGCTCGNDQVDGHLKSRFHGYTFSGSTELARPFYFGKFCQWTVRPYMALDLSAIWQNSASETGDFNDAYLVALDYNSASNVRLYGRTGIGIERGGNRGNLHGGVSYSYLMGGRRYTNVDNRFQFGGDDFNIRGVDDGSGTLNLNAGSTVYLDKCHRNMIHMNYWFVSGSHSAAQAVQLGFQKIF